MPEGFRHSRGAEVYRAFHGACSDWMYFCDLCEDILKTIVLRCLPSLTSGALPRRPLVGVELDFLGSLLLSVAGI